jgi:hypothetical protein
MVTKKVCCPDGSKERSTAPIQQQMSGTSKHQCSLALARSEGLRQQGRVHHELGLPQQFVACMSVTVHDSVSIEALAAAEQS